MAAPSRMPRYDVRNDGMGPYATFYCDKCYREYRSQPSIKQQVQRNITNTAKRGAFGGLLRNIPLVGDSIANNMEQDAYQDQYRTDMAADELATAWGEVPAYFSECPTCHQILCVPDFDEVSGYCTDDSPRAGEIAEAQAAQAAGVMKGFANAFGLGDAIEKAQEAAAGATTCTKCGNMVAAGQQFCGSCGTPVAQVRTCPNCSAQVAAGQGFCGNCGTKIA